MARSTTITLEHDTKIDNLTSSNKDKALVQLGNVFHGYAGGAHRGGTLQISPNQEVAQAAASGTITLASCAAGTVIEVNGEEFVAVASDTDNDLGEFDVSGADAADATALATAINASTSTKIAGVLTASSTGSSGVVTITADREGYQGNSITLKTKGICASTYVTCASVVATDTLVINGAALTAVASGATGDQFNVGATDAATATAIAAAVNASATALISGSVYAYADGAVVRLRAKHPGLIGNAVTVSSTGGTMTVNDARMVGGTIASAEGVQASSTVTISGADAGNYTVTINGVGTGNIAGTNGDDTATAASIAAGINVLTNALVRGIVEASSSSGVVTVKAVRGGISGNQITLACTGTGATAANARLVSGAVPTTVVLSGERLTGGTGGTADTVSFTL